MKIGHILGAIALAGMVWWAVSEYKKAKKKHPPVKIIR